MESGADRGPLDVGSDRVAAHEDHGAVVALGHPIDDRRVEAVDQVGIVSGAAGENVGPVLAIERVVARPCMNDCEVFRANCIE